MFKDLLTRFGRGVVACLLALRDKVVGKTSLPERGRRALLVLVESDGQPELRVYLLLTPDQQKESLDELADEILCRMRELKAA